MRIEHILGALDPFLEVVLLYQIDVKLGLIDYKVIIIPTEKVEFIKI